LGKGGEGPPPSGHKRESKPLETLRTLSVGTVPGTSRKEKEGGRKRLEADLDVLKKKETQQVFVLEKG